MTELIVTPWEYSAIRKNAMDMHDSEFLSWVLEKWPFLREHFYEEIKVIVDFQNGNAPTPSGESIDPIYILSTRFPK